MEGPKFIFCVLTIVALSTGALSRDFATLDHISASASPQTQQQAVNDLLKRLLDTRSTDFMIVIDSTIGPKGKDTFKLMTVNGGKLQVTGTSGLAAAWGTYYYLTQYCNSQVTWGGKQVDLPTTLPTITTPVVVTSNDRFRYYQNVCTVSYSFVWWDWERWEREIDWMALSGIDLPLAFNGQEAIWDRVYRKMGFTEADMNAFFSGPAFLAWKRMGNMRGWGGPLSTNWHNQQIALQHKILQRMRDLGITPVLPAFAGHVPRATTRVFPNASVSQLGDWGSMPQEYCCTSLLDVEDPLFVQIGGAFLKEYISEFGTDHVYNADTFNEMTPKSSDPAYLKSAGEAVFKAMTVTDPDAIWLMQGWLFYNEMSFWQPAQAKALLTSVPQGRMIILDLYSELDPQYTRLQSYYGQPFIWCMLHDFGGTVAMYGVSENVNKGPFSGRTFANSTMIGTGLTPEGINQNEVMYEMMNENSWRKEPRDLKDWFMNYPIRRYGAQDSFAQNAWSLLMQTVYSCTDHYTDHGKDVIIVNRPKLFIFQRVWYDPEEVYQAWDNMLMAAKNLAIKDKILFRYDLVDVTRQSLQLISIKYYNDLIRYFKSKDMDQMMASGKDLLDLLSNMDMLLGSDSHFLLGNWISDARALGMNDDEKKMYEYNARNQITLWGPTGNILDYANKQWSGLINGYYRPRWEYFLMTLKQTLMKNTTFDQSKFNADILKDVEQPFTFDNTTYPNMPMGDSLGISQNLHSVYRSMTKANSKFFKKLPEFTRKGPKFVKYAGKWVTKDERREKKKNRLLHNRSDYHRSGVSVMSMKVKP